ncbi:hypothetical protein BC938DRAFT_482795 [Jimgerdemannia flammicorona]|uniref:Galactosyl transferase GMA12/MNN10 family-domain-containing protein n=1 Tax=Jimgerdemannia flammicorona TaxID=994334 RepID=A0A433QD67_9FUNG|nr:hypothetical protein BC938DRAFT_482795 [Jimgerdemannia flammicorona]
MGARKYLFLVVIILVTLIITFHRALNLTTQNLWPFSSSTNIAIVTFHGARADKSLKSKQEYASHWGYELLVGEPAYEDISSAWPAISYLHSLTHRHPHIKWFWYLSPTALIMNSTLTLESHILHNLTSPQYRDRDLIVAWDCRTLNTASFLLRNSKWSRPFLELVLARQGANTVGEVMERLYWENQLLGQRYHFVPARTVCGLAADACDDGERYLYHEGDFVLDFPFCAEKCTAGSMLEGTKRQDVDHNT